MLEYVRRSYKLLKTLDVSAVTNTSLPDEAFKECYNLKTLVLPANLEQVSYMAVADCKHLQSVTIPASVEDIDDSAFENCRSLSSLTFEDGSLLTRIGSWAFYNCHNLTSVEIPEGVTEIGDAAFYGCVYAESLHLPSSVQSIGDNGFAFCSKLNTMHVDAVTPPDVEEKTFYEVSTVAPVYVPDASVMEYKSHPVWGRLNIRGKNNVPTDISDTEPVITQKLLRDGQLLILRGDKTYTVTGQEVR